MSAPLPPHDPLPECDCNICAVIERNNLRLALAGISEEMGLPPTIGPAKGDLKRILDQGAAAIEAIRAAVQGPDGYASWQDAATAERVQRVKLRNTLQGIAEADPRKWEELAEPIGEFARWAKSRAAHALTGGE